MRMAVITSHPVQYYAPLFRELARAIDIHVFFAHDPSPEQQAEGFGKEFSWDVDLRSGYAHSFLRNVAADPDTARFSGCDTPEIGKRLRDGGFDVVLALGWHLKSQLQGIMAAKRLGIPVMIRGDSQLGTARSLSKRIAKMLSYPLLLRAFDAALYVGVRNYEYYRHYGYPVRQLFHSPHAIDTDWFAARASDAARMRKRTAMGVDAEARIVMFAGKTQQLKRPLDAVAATAGLIGRGWPAHLMIAGSGEMSDAIAAEAARLNVPLHSLGFLNQSEMPAAYAAADILLLPSESETWGLVCNEALACGTPIVVSSEIGCAPDLCDGIVGRQYQCGKADKATDELDAMLSLMPAPSTIRAVSARFSLQLAARGIISAAEKVRK